MEQLFELIGSSGDGALAIDRQQRIVFWNDACERILGFAAPEVIGRACYEIIGGTSADGCTVCRQDCVAMRSRAEHEPLSSRHLSVTHRDGHDIWISVSTILVPSAWSELSVLIHLIRDISAYKRIESMVTDLTGEVARQKAAKSRHDSFVTIAVTERERQVLQAMFAGRTTPEIADDLNISSATARNHIHNILTKLGVRNRLEAIILGLRNGLL